MLEAPSPLETKSTSCSSTGNVGREMSHHIVGEDWSRASSSGQLEEKGAQALPFDPDGVNENGAQQSSHARRCGGPPTPTFAVDSNAISTAPVPPGLERGGGVDAGGCASVAVSDHAGDGCLEHQETPAIITGDASADDAKTRCTLPDAAAKVAHEAGAALTILPPPQVACKDRPPSPCMGVGDGPGTRARSDGEEVLSKPPDNSGDEGANAVLSGSNEDCCRQVFSTQSHQKAAAPWSNPLATTTGTPGATFEEAGEIEPPSPLGVERKQSLARAEASSAATSSPSGVLVDNHRASADEGELGSLLSTFERQLERGAELVRRFEEAAKPSLALDDDEVKAEGGGHGKLEDGNTDLSTMTPSSTSSEEKHFTEDCSFATNTAGLAVATEQSAPDPLRIAATPGKAGTESDREPERTEKNSNTRAEVLYLDGVPEQPSTDEGKCTNPSPSPLEDQTPSPDTDITLDEDNEDYEFTFDDEEVAVGGQKSVQFTDESRWSTHEVRACFEKHELGELFYTTAELDSMLEEAESEEALERSGALLLQESELLGNAEAAGVGTGSSLSVGGSQAPKRGAGNRVEEVVSFEKVSVDFDDEDSDYDF